MARCVILLAALAGLLWTVQASTLCSTGHDCPPDHCCVDSEAPAVGRRDSSLPGSCQPTKRIGDACDPSVLHAFEPPKDLVQSCPCRRGLLCAPYTIQGVKHGMCSFG